MNEITLYRPNNDVATVRARREPNVRDEHDATNDIRVSFVGVLALIANPVLNCFIR
jgi:hypothetical protein